MRFPTMWYVRPAKAQTSLRIRAVWSEPLLVAWIFYDFQATGLTPFGVSKLTCKRRLHRLVWVYSMTCQNTTLLEITCCGSFWGNEDGMDMFGDHHKIGLDFDAISMQLRRFSWGKVWNGGCFLGLLKFPIFLGWLIFPIFFMGGGGGGGGWMVDAESKPTYEEKMIVPHGYCIMPLLWHSVK